MEKEKKGSRKTKKKEDYIEKYLRNPKNEDYPPQKMKPQSKMK